MRDRSGGDEIARSDELIAVIQDGSECGEAWTWAKKDQGMEKGGVGRGWKGGGWKNGVDGLSFMT